MKSTLLIKTFMLIVLFAFLSGCGGGGGNGGGSGSSSSSNWDEMVWDQDDWA